MTEYRVKTGCHHGIGLRSEGEGDAQLKSSLVPHEETEYTEGETKHSMVYFSLL